MNLNSFEIFTDVVRLHFEDYTYLDVRLDENTGKILTRKKNPTLSNVQHTGIWLGESVMTGETLVMHNHLFTGGGKPHVSTYKNYASGERVYLKPGSCTNDVYIILDIALTHIVQGKRYRPLSYNCQIFSSTACNSQPVSEDVAKWGKGVLVAAGVGLFLNIISG